MADSVEALCEQVDAVFVCTWTAAHHEAVAAAVEAGRAVFCEKPLAPDLARAEALCALVERAGVTNQVGLVLRRSPAFTLVRQLLADPDAGRVMAVVLRDDQFIPTQGMYGSDWRADPAKAGAGTILEHSIHDVDLLEWLLGPIDRVSAWTREFHAIEGIEDAATASFSFASGAVGSMVSVWHDVLERPSLRHVEILGERLHVAVEGDWFGPVRWTLTGAGRAGPRGGRSARRPRPAPARGRQPRQRVPRRGGRGPTGLARRRRSAPRPPGRRRPVPVGGGRRGPRQPLSAPSLRPCASPSSDTPACASRPRADRSSSTPG